MKRTSFNSTPLRHPVYPCNQLGKEHDYYYDGPGRVEDNGRKLHRYQCARCGATTERIE